VYMELGKVFSLTDVYIIKAQLLLGYDVCLLVFSVAALYVQYLLMYIHCEDKAGMLINFRSFIQGWCMSITDVYIVKARLVYG